MRRSLVAVIVLLVGFADGLAASSGGAGQAPSPAPPFARPSLGPAVAAMTSPEKAAIVAAIEMFLRSEDYFDVAALDSVLHPDARGWSTANGEAEHEPWGAYMTWLRSSQPKPAPRDHSRDVRQITSLVHHGDLAQAVLMTRHPWPAGPGITIYWAIQLLKSAGRWTIVGLAGSTDRFDGQTDDRTLDAMGIRPGMTIGEVGAGQGRFTVALSRRVGPAGKVFANDIDAKALAALTARCTRLGLGNVETVPGKVDDALLPKQAVDVVVMVSVFHHLEQPVVLLRNLATALKPGGTVVILDPAFDRTGESDSNRPSTVESVRKEASEAGFDLVRTESFLPNDNIFVLRPRSSRPLKTDGPGRLAAFRSARLMMLGVDGLPRRCQQEAPWKRNFASRAARPGVGRASTSCSATSASPPCARYRVDGCRGTSDGHAGRGATGPARFPVLRGALHAVYALALVSYLALRGPSLARLPEIAARRRGRTPSPAASRPRRRRSSWAWWGCSTPVSSCFCWPRSESRSWSPGAGR